MSQFDLLRTVLRILGSLQIEHMLVGSYASSFHGESRSTHDVDLVIDLPEEKIPLLANAFDERRYYISMTALRERRLANVIDTHSGDKVDLFFVSDKLDSRREFSRRQPHRIFDTQVYIATAEDVILSKLRWDAHLGGSEQQRSDITNILRIRKDQLDWSYLYRYAADQRVVLDLLVKSVSEGR